MPEMLSNPIADCKINQLVFSQNFTHTKRAKHNNRDNCSAQSNWSLFTKLEALNNRIPGQRPARRRLKSNPNLRHNQRKQG